MKLHYHVLLIVLFTGLFLQDTHGQDQKTSAVKELIGRVLPTYRDSFELEILPAAVKDTFAVAASPNGKILLKGNNGVALSSAFYYYLTNYCHCNITWDSRQLHIPSPMPAVDVPVGKSTNYNARYYLNYCTYNYSMSWWNWERWEKEIDWMAMHGINLPLALTGEESIWNDVYQEMGLSRRDLADFFCGPAYFSWFWMGNLDGWNGPLSDHWMQRQKTLQLKILERERSLGMKPVLPAFTGHVPRSLLKYYPRARIKKTNWDAGFDDVYILDPEDSLFGEIGRRFLKHQTAVYGTDHFYSADTFNENVPPSNDSAYLDGITKKIYATMTGVDPRAKWLMQGWMFHYNKAYWGEKQVSSLLHAIPGDNLIILDLYSESHPMWENAHSYYGKPWIWNMLQNFGGNTGLFGRMNAVAHEPYATYHNPRSGNMMGIGLAPEGIEQNPALFALMLHNVWHSDSIRVREFLHAYARNRYGRENEQLNKAWDILYRTVYDGGMGEGAPESIIVSRPMMADSSQRVRTTLSYHPADLLPAWDIFIAQANKHKPNEGYLYDLTDLTRQVLANYAFVVYKQWIADYHNRDWSSFKKHSAGFLDLMEDMDRLLATNENFLLGKWIADARACGITPEEKDQYEKNARDLVTLWGGRGSGLSEYSNRQWAGLIKGYYKQRWQQYFDYLIRCHEQHRKPDFDAINNRIMDWEWKWVNTTSDHFSTEPQPDGLRVIRGLYRKYYSLMQSSYRK